MNQLWCSTILFSALIECGCAEHTYNTVQEKHVADVVARYSTVQEARVANVFERYLPDVLPESSKDILVKHKVDSTGYSGGFCFDAHERSTFFSVLSDTIDTNVWGKDYANAISTFGAARVHVLEYDSSRGNWIFLCADGDSCCNWMKR
jgi:hypothetical protein